VYQSLSADLRSILSCSQHLFAQDGVGNANNDPQSAPPQDEMLNFSPWLKLIRHQWSNAIPALWDRLYLIASSCLHRAEQETPTMGLSLRLTWMKCSISRPDRSA